jgi:general secretion pathway protein M
VRAWIESNRHAAVLVGATLALPLVILLYLVVDLLGVRAEYQREIDRLEPRIARLRGLVESEELLGNASGRLASRVQDLVYPASEDDASVSAALQNSVREIATDAGLTVSNSQVLKVKEEDGFERIGLKLTVSGDIGALDTALLDLSTFTPLLLVESIEIWPARQSRRNKEEQPGQTLTATLELLSLRALQ